MVQLSPGTDIPDLGGEKHVILKSARRRFETTIERIRCIRGKTVLKLSGIHSIDDALKLVGYSIFASGESIDGRTTLIDYRVRDLNQEYWGQVVAVREHGLNRVMEIESRGDIIYVPLAWDIVREIRDREKVIVIDPPEGLRNLNQ